MLVGGHTSSETSQVRDTAAIVKQEYGSGEEGQDYIWGSDNSTGNGPGVRKVRRE